jgi:hypothetical protein
MSTKTITFRPLTGKEKNTFSLKCEENANEQSKMQCPRPIVVAMETAATRVEDDTITDLVEPTRYFCSMHGMYKKIAVEQAVVADTQNYGLKEEDNV